MTLVQANKPRGTHMLATVLRYVVAVKLCLLLARDLTAYRHNFVKRLRQYNTETVTLRNPENSTAHNVICLMPKNSGLFCFQSPFVVVIFISKAQIVVAAASAAIAVDMAIGLTYDFMSIEISKRKQFRCKAMQTFASMNILCRLITKSSAEYSFYFSF
uniref:Uncharacterized protein n=1 Tax=Glossina pallidipes TaxID=7398 RepID=A0A1A9ZY83_GLOPL